MNTKILQKCVEELKKDSYSKEYVLGMLETLIEMQDTKPQMTYATAGYLSVPPSQPDPVIADLVNPVITGFKDLIPKEETNDIESKYLGGAIGKV